MNPDQLCNYYSHHDLSSVQDYHTGRQMYTPNPGADDMGYFPSRQDHHHQPQHNHHHHSTTNSNDSYHFNGMHDVLRSDISTLYTGNPRQKLSPPISPDAFEDSGATLMYFPHHVVTSSASTAMAPSNLQYIVTQPIGSDNPNANYNRMLSLPEISAINSHHQTDSPSINASNNDSGLFRSGGNPINDRDILLLDDMKLDTPNHNGATTTSSGAAPTGKDRVTSMDDASFNLPKKAGSTPIEAKSRGRRASTRSEATETARHFMCSEVDCNKVFKRSEHLKRHVRSIHTMEKPFPCPTCGKGFSRTDNLNQHVRIHTRPKTKVSTIRSRHAHAMHHQQQQQQQQQQHHHHQQHPHHHPHHPYGSDMGMDGFMSMVPFYHQAPRYDQNSFPTPNMVASSTFHPEDSHPHHHSGSNPPPSHHHFPASNPSVPPPNHHHHHHHHSLDNSIPLFHTQC